MKQLYFVLFIIFSVPASFVSAQVNTDSVFAIALSLSRNQQYTSALEKAKLSIESDPTRADILVFIANLYSWQEQNEMALVYINKAHEMNYRHDDFYESWTNILLRSHQYEALLLSCTEAENNNYSKPVDLLRKRLIAYTELKAYDKGISLIESPPNKKFLTDEAVDGLYTTLLLKRNTKIVSAYYTLDFFDSVPDPQHLASLGYSFHVNKHSLGFRANYANRFGMNDVQLETDFYLLLKKKKYLYLNYGYSFNSSLFPEHRFGTEFYFNLFPKTDASIGGRYLIYTNSNVSIFTGHLGHYLGKNWVAIRPFYVWQKLSHSLSFIANYRHYSNSELD